MSKKEPLKIEDFSVRDPKGRYQARFWTSEEAYKNFKVECERRGLKLQDVFNQFIEWFSQEK